jgi:hypothetical protein
MDLSQLALNFFPRPRRPCGRWLLHVVRTSTVTTRRRMMTALVAVAVAVSAAAVAATALPPSSTVVVDGRLRVQALSPTLIRVEPRAPMGFEDRSTFGVVGREHFAGIPIARNGTTTSGAVRLSTVAYDVHVTQRGSNGSDLNVTIVVTSPGGGAVLYNSTAWIESTQHAPPSVSSALTEKGPPPPPPAPGSCKSFGSGAEIVCDHHSSPKPNLLHWPSPLAQSAFALIDYPRFHAPAWGPMPAPPSALDPALNQTNGYDFRNSVGHVTEDEDGRRVLDFAGDTYIFLLGDTLPSWQASRAEFVKLAGPTPVLPDFAWGTWFTYWHQYSFDDAKSNVSRWEAVRKRPFCAICI